MLDRLTNRTYSSSPTAMGVQVRTDVQVTRNEEITQEKITPHLKFTVSSRPATPK